MVARHARRWALTAITLAALIGIIGPWVEVRTKGEAFRCTVRSVYDGDTLTAICEGEKTKVRFYCIDTPEMQQKPWGRRSRDHLRNLLPAGSPIQIKKHGADRYGRIIGEVLTQDGDNLNRRMVQDGMAAVYEKYCSEPTYYQAQKTAQQASIGIWSQSGLQQTPWEYRHRHR